MNLVESFAVLIAGKPAPQELSRSQILWERACPR
jgi:hypothetical protein